MLRTTLVRDAILVWTAIARQVNSQTIASSGLLGPLAPERRRLVSETSMGCTVVALGLRGSVSWRRTFVSMI